MGSYLELLCQTDGEQRLTMLDGRINKRGSTIAAGPRVSGILHWG